MSRIAAAGSFSPPPSTSPTVAVQVNVTIPQPPAAEPESLVWVALGRIETIIAILGGLAAFANYLAGG